jgi:CubicO group peptidase (beta-lactamase class C family)
MKSFLMLLLAVLAFSAEAHAQDCPAPPVDLKDGWTRATPAEVGLDPARLCDLDAVLEQWPHRNIHAVIVVHRGKLVMERYFAGPDERWGWTIGDVKHAPDVKHDLRSMSKSVTSLLVGIASGEGKFPALDSAVFDSFPELAALATPEKRRITFRHLLTMSSGLAWDENIPYSSPLNSERRLIDSSDPMRFILEQPLSSAPGTFYNYSGGDTTLLAAVVARTTGKRIEDYARDRLFGPLDISDFDWVRMPNGETAAASGLRLRPRDAAKLGQLMLDDGRWNGRQVLPRGWATESSQPRINGRGVFLYGYQWWLGRSLRANGQVDWVAAFGLGGQTLYVVPSLDLVVMVNAGHYSNALQGIIPPAILNYVVLPAVKD